MRRVFLLIPLLLLAACASGAPSKSGTSESLVSRAPAMTDDEVADYVAELASERMEALCQAHQGVTAQLECAREVVFRGFDTTGEAKRHCDADASFRESLRCAILGSLGYGLARAAQIPTDDYNWSDPSAALKDTVSAVSTTHLQECLQGSISAADSCIVERLGRTLSLSGQQVTTCTDKASLDNSVRCLLRIHLIQEFESAIARMGPGEVQA